MKRSHIKRDTNFKLNVKKCYDELYLKVQTKFYIYELHILIFYELCMKRSRATFALVMTV